VGAGSAWETRQNKNLERFHVSVKHKNALVAKIEPISDFCDGRYADREAISSKPHDGCAAPPLQEFSEAATISLRLDPEMRFEFFSGGDAGPIIVH
jgi:hypothetical protein